MNDNDLERQLRTQAGPREEGYVPTRLPTSPDEVPARRPSPLMRAAVLIPAVAAGVVAVAVAGAVLRGGAGTKVGADLSPSSTPTATVVDGMPVCRNDDLAISAEPWGGAAGSRGTVLSVQLAEGRANCALIPTTLAAQIADANGKVVITSKIPHPMSRDVFELANGDVHTQSVVWSNWCGYQPTIPVSLSVSAEEGTNWKAVSVPAGGIAPVPPCSGASEPSTLTVTQLQGAQ
jgi:hypothetical protein